MVPSPAIAKFQAGPRASLSEDVMHNLYYLEKLAEEHATQPPDEDRGRGVTDPEERQRELEGRGEPVRLARVRLGRMLIRLGTRIAA